jgi:hypothetical protein
MQVLEILGLRSRRRTTWCEFFGPIVLSQSLLMVAGKPEMLGRPRIYPVGAEQKAAP